MLCGAYEFVGPIDRRRLGAHRRRDDHALAELKERLDALAVPDGDRNRRRIVLNQRIENAALLACARL